MDAGVDPPLARVPPVTSVRMTATHRTGFVVKGEVDVTGDVAQDVSAVTVLMAANAVNEMDLRKATGRVYLNLTVSWVAS